MYPDVGQHALTPTAMVNPDDAMSSDPMPGLRQQNMPPQAAALSYQPTQIPLTYGSSPNLSGDFWDPSILSNTNWLEAVSDFEFPGLPFSLDFSNEAIPAVQAQSRQWDAPRPSQPVNQSEHRSFRSHVESPLAVASSASARSGISSETAADVLAAQADSSNTVGEYYVDG